MICRYLQMFIIFYFSRSVSDEMSCDSFQYLCSEILGFEAIIGMFFQDGLTGSAWGDWSLYTSSPLRAGRESKVARNFFGGDSSSYASFDPAKELGVQEPIGFWDPLGLSADKDEATFKRRRAVEIKHGRIVPS